MSTLLQTHIQISIMFTRTINSMLGRKRRLGAIIFVVVVAVKSIKSVVLTFKPNKMEETLPINTPSESLYKTAYSIPAVYVRNCRECGDAHMRIEIGKFICNKCKEIKQNKKQNGRNNNLKIW